MTDSNTTNTQQDPEEIERDIRRTQDQMSRTVDKIGDQLTARNILNSLLDRAENNDIDARTLLDGARRNPIALAMIAGGAIWLASDSDAKLPKMGGGSKSSGDDNHHDPFHRDYVAHMERVERSPNEDELTYQRRRDQHRANYLMIERGHEEDDHSFRQRLDSAAERFREKRRAWSDAVSSGASSAGSSVRSGGSAAVSRTQDAYASNPLIGGLIAAAVGAIAGTVLPLTRTEEENLSGVGETARGMVGEQKDKLVSAARERKDELIAKVEEKGQPSTQLGSEQTSSQGDMARSQFSGANDSEEAPRQLAAEEPGSEQASEWQSSN